MCVRASSSFVAERDPRGNDGRVSGGGWGSCVPVGGRCRSVRPVKKKEEKKFPATFPTSLGSSLLFSLYLSFSPLFPCCPYRSLMRASTFSCVCVCVCAPPPPPRRARPLPLALERAIFKPGLPADSLSLSLARESSAGREHCLACSRSLPACLLYVPERSCSGGPWVLPPVDLLPGASSSSSSSLSRRIVGPFRRTGSEVDDEGSLVVTRHATTVNAAPLSSRLSCFFFGLECGGWRRSEAPLAAIAPR